MLTINDLERDILNAVLEAPQMRLQRFGIRDQLRSKYEKPYAGGNPRAYAKGSFDVVLQRRLDSLSALGFLKREYIDRKSFYFIPNRMKSQIQRVLVRNDIYDLTDSFDIKWLRMLRGLLDSLKKEGVDPYEYFKSNCLVFVGGIPRTFHKSKEDMQAIIEWENALETRAQKEGITKEEYWSNKLKEAAQMPKGPRRILTSLGFTEEEIEELRERQGGTFEVTRRTRKKV